jgi:hypothetical protein
MLLKMPALMGYYGLLVGGFKHGFDFPFHMWDNPSH